MFGNREYTLSERIKDIRRKLGLTMEEFGQKLDPPVAKGTISKWENGRYNPNDERIIQIAKLANIRPQYLLTGDPFDNLSIEEQEKWVEEELRKQTIQKYIVDFENEKYVNIEEFVLKDSSLPRYLYVNGHRLENEDLLTIIKMFEGREKNYPSYKEIEEEYYNLRSQYLEYLEQKQTKKIFLAFGEYTHYKFHK